MRNPGLWLDSKAGVILWVLNLWDLTPGRQCQNWIYCRTHSCCPENWKTYTFVVRSSWPKTNSLLCMSPVKMGLSGISRELQFSFCNHREPFESPRTAKEGKHFYREEKEIARAIVNKESMAFHWLNPCEERRVFLLIGLCHCGREWELPFLVSRLYLIEVSVYEFFIKCWQQ